MFELIEPLSDTPVNETTDNTTNSLELLDDLFENLNLQNAPEDLDTILDLLNSD